MRIGKKPLDIQFQKMSNSDIETIHSIELMTSLSNPWTKNIFKDCLDVGYECWLLITNKKIIGFGILAISINEAHILNIAIDPDYQNMGYGRYLIEYLFSISEKLSISNIFLEVQKSNRVAIQLYKSLQFKIIGERKNYYRTKHGREDAQIMLKQLAPKS